MDALLAVVKLKKMMNKSNKDFWNDKYLNNEDGWDLGQVSPALKSYIDQLEDKSIRILIPGAGRAYEAEYLFNKGFKNVFVVDISPFAIKELKKRVPQIPENQIICTDFFEFTGQFDLILEQTFFCAINPKLRTKYAQHCSELLAKCGKIAGLMFNFPLTEDGPPFGGSKNEYENLFKENFVIKTMEESTNSLEKRSGREFFVIMINK